MQHKNFFIGFYILLESTLCNLRYVGFKRIGNYYITDENGNSHEKVYYVASSFRANWMNSKSFCSSYGMHLLALESDHEAKYFMKACENISNIFEEVSHIGVTSDLINESEKWFLTTTGKEINYKFNISNNSEEGQCLSLEKANGKFSYKRIDCNGSAIHQFICQKLILKVENWMDIFGR